MTFQSHTKHQPPSLIKNSGLSTSLEIYLIFVCFWLTACEGPVPTDLDRAAKVVRYMSRDDVLARSSFPKKYPEGKPSDFVKWFLSKEGRTQWPASLDNSDSNPEIRKEAYRQGAPIVPCKMTFLANQTNPKKGRQLVIKSDDGQGLIIVEGYANPEARPDLKRQWALSGT